MKTIQQMIFVVNMMADLCSKYDVSEEIAIQIIQAVDVSCHTIKNIFKNPIQYYIFYYTITYLLKIPIDTRKPRLMMGFIPHAYHAYAGGNEIEIIKLIYGFMVNSIYKKW